MVCLPWWHSKITAVPRTPISSGCSVNSAGNVPCSPETMRAGAQTKMRQLGLWPADKPLTLDVYTLGRYMTSEVGSGSVEDQVAVAEAARNKAKARKQNVVDLLLYTAAPANKGYYGPIHSSGLSAPYGRWASTSKDPTAQALAIAALVLSGESGDLARGATTQWGLDVLIKNGRDPYDFVNDLAAKGHYWVGPIPGVDHFHTWLVRESIPKPERLLMGKAFVERAHTAIKAGRPSWSGLPVCPRPIFGGAVGGVLVGLGAGVGAVLVLGKLGIVRR